MLYGYKINQIMLVLMMVVVQKEEKDEKEIHQLSPNQGL